MTENGADALISSPDKQTSSLTDMLSALLGEMKTMNQKLDVLTDPLDNEAEGSILEEEEAEDGEIPGDNDEALSIDTKVKQLTTRSNSSHSSVLHSIAQELDLSEKTGRSIDKELAMIINSLLTNKIPEDNMQLKINKYPRPENVEGLRTPRVNPLIWNQLPAQVRTKDTKSQKMQNALVASLVAITQATDLVLQQNQVDNKDLVTCLTDSIALAMQCLHDMNATRRQAMKKDLHKDYAALCNNSTVPPTSEYLFGDLSKLAKDISDANKLTKKVRPAQYTSNIRGRKYYSDNQPYYLSRQSGQRNRRFTPYARSRSDFFGKGRPPKSKNRKEGDSKQ